MTIAANYFCPRCLYSAPRLGELHFCPRCGLADEGSAVFHGPAKIPFAGRVIQIGEPIAFGDVANLYRWSMKGDDRVGIFKIARTHMANHYLKREAYILRQLYKADELNTGEQRFRYTPFLPIVQDEVLYSQGSAEPARAALILSYHAGITGPDELYSLEEVRQQYPGGIDGRDMAWMWRRVLTILAFIHQERFVHGCVTPDHLLIEPTEHKLVLIGWGSAAHFQDGPTLVPKRWNGWSKWTGGASPATDLSAAAKSMLYLLRADSDPGIIRHLERASCGASSGGASKLLDDFDLLIDALWGPRQFRPFALTRTQPLGKELGHG